MASASTVRRSGATLLGSRHKQRTGHPVVSPTIERGKGIPPSFLIFLFPKITPCFSNQPGVPGCRERCQSWAQTKSDPRVSGTTRWLCFSRSNAAVVPFSAVCLPGLFPGHIQAAQQAAQNDAAAQSHHDDCGGAHFTGLLVGWRVNDAGCARVCASAADRPKACPGPRSSRRP